MSPGLIGQPLTRADGAAKVTGAARYTADTPIEGLSHAALVLSTIAHGRVIAIDSSSATDAPGVLTILTHETAPRISALEGSAQSFLPLQDDRIRHEGQPVALVVAESPEQARHAAELIDVSYAAEASRVDFRAHLDDATKASSWTELDTSTGDVDAALATADAVADAVYTTADRHHNPMEPSVTIAEWRDSELLIHDATQYVYGVRAAAASAFGLAPQHIRVHNDFVGGGFGCKGFVWPHQLLAALAARVVRRPVRLALTRADTYTSHGRQPATEQRVTLGARRDGTLVGLRHSSVNPTSVVDGYVELAAVGSRSLYSCPALETRHRVVPVDLPLPTPMRAPHEGPGMVGLEIAMDELAQRLDTDPLELRIRNHADVDPTRGVPFSSKRLLDCYRRGAERFGWSGRSAQPRSMHAGRDLIGWGMATALMTTFRFPATARVSIDQRGEVLIEAGSQEIGTGVRTIMPQIAADVLGVDPARVSMVLGDTSLPETQGTYGSSTTLSVGSAVLEGARKLRADLGELADDTHPDPAGYGELLRAHDLERLAALGEWTPGDADATDLSMHTFGAVFAEVRVDVDICVPRVTRIVGVYSAGRIINARTARSQVTGGMVWRIGQALLECSEVDPNLGRFLSKNLAGYLLPVNADVPELDASFIEDEVDEHASLLGAKGVGELGAVGAGPAIANAVSHATGVRIRDLPIRPEVLLDGR